MSTKNVMVAIKGTLVISGDDILVALDVPVSPGNFEPVYKDAYLLNRSVKGIVFRYYDVLRPTYPDGDDVTSDMIVKFGITNCYDWPVGTVVRIMCINESTSSEFRSLDHYFIRRLDKFKDRTDVSSQEYKDFNREWNIIPGNTRVFPEFHIFPFKDEKDIYNPRKTRDDGILTLDTRKK